MGTCACCPNQESWKKYWLSGSASLIAVIQLFISFAILAIHAAIVGIGIIAFCIGAAPWFVMGFVCWFFFIKCWISIFCVSCCHRSSVRCATYVLITNILAFVFSAVLIDFDRKFINGQSDLFSGYYIGSCSPNINTNGNTDFGSIMLSLAKGELAGSVVMLVTSFIFVIIYIYTYIRSIRHDGTNRGNAYSYRDQPPRQQTNMVVSSAQTSMPGYQQPGMRQPEPINQGYNIINCPKCGTNIVTSERF